MANTNQSVRTCILKVDLKCCTSCQKKASIKLKSISGVNEVDYDQEKGLMTVTGDVEPMALVRKLTKCGRKTELVSVKYQFDDDLDSDEEDSSSSSDTSSYPDPKTMARQLQEKMMMQPNKKKTGIFRNPSSLLGCFSSKSKVVQPLPMRNRNWIPSKFANPPPGFGYPPPHQMMQHPPHPSMMQQRPPPPMMQQPPQGPTTGAPYYDNTLWQAPPPRQPYYLSRQQKVTPALHYQK
ncbi:Heavy metal-associated isoprenylated plant protein 34 [Cardamine amara subsp. amara]|uniref:Heavy metal-associated isoprenylated plant protein 34 n=1 Tax=Cardamine amara subsp. amara TaxID=228776 RepID=A0ABD1AEI0_CARAN